MVGVAAGPGIYPYCIVGSFWQNEANWCRSSPPKAAAARPCWRKKIKHPEGASRIGHANLAEKYVADLDP
jgi:hypothetical protein